MPFTNLLLIFGVSFCLKKFFIWISDGIPSLPLDLRMKLSWWCFLQCFWNRSRFQLCLKSCPKNSKSSGAPMSCDFRFRKWNWLGFSTWHQWAGGTLEELRLHLMSFWSLSIYNDETKSVRITSWLESRMMLACAHPPKSAPWRVWHGKALCLQHPGQLNFFWQLAANQIISMHCSKKGRKFEFTL